MENISLTKFSQVIGVAKSSIHARCKELGIETSSGLSPSAQAQLKAEFNYQELVSDTEPEMQSPNSWGLSIIAPENRSKPVPELGGDIELVNFGVVNNEHFDDPMDLAEKAIKGIEAIEDALDLHLQGLEEKRRKTLDSNRKLTSKKEEFQRKVLKAQLRAEFMEKEISRAEESISEGLGILGKSQSA